MSTLPNQEPDSKPKTAKELYQALSESGFIGLWKDRDDIADSVSFARKLREQAQSRYRD